MAARFVTPANLLPFRSGRKGSCNMKTKKKTKAKTTEKPLSELRKNFATEFERLASNWGDDLAPNEVKSLSVTAGCLISEAIDAGLFVEYRNSLETEYQFGLKKSKNEGWRRLWQQLIEILRLRRGLSLLEGTFSENCQLVADDLNKKTVDKRRYDKKSSKKTKRTSETKRTPQPLFSEPLAWNKWALIFGLSPNKLRELRKQGKYHFDQVSGRRWRLPMDELPAEYLQKFRPHTSQTPAKAQ